MRSFSAANVGDQWLSSALMAMVAPRPIALVSTVSATGIRNLAPFSFFNICSVRPPVVMFSCLRRMRDGSAKDTERNLSVTPECAIQIVTEDLLYPQHIAAVDFPEDIDEFDKSGLTPLRASRISAPLVAEASLILECTVISSQEFGSGGGSARVFFCEVLVLHVEEKHISAAGAIDAADIKHIGRQSGPVYCRGFGNSLFKLDLPNSASVVGVDKIPAKAKGRFHKDRELLARLGATQVMPPPEQVRLFWRTMLKNGRRTDDSVPTDIRSTVAMISNGKPVGPARLAQTVRKALDVGAHDLAWYIALH